LPRFRSQKKSFCEHFDNCFLTLLPLQFSEHLKKTGKVCAALQFVPCSSFLLSHASGSRASMG
jgi:hypothetical protein